MAYIKYFTNSFGRRIFTTSTVSLNNGAISSSLNPAMPQPILVTRNVSGGLPGPSDEFIHIGSDRIHTTLHRGGWHMFAHEVLRLLPRPLQKVYK